MRRAGSVIAAILVTIAVTTACSSSGKGATSSGAASGTASGSGPAITLRISNVSTAPGQFFNAGLADWKNLVSEETGGKLTLDIYSGTITTDESAELTDVKTGIIDGAVMSASPVASLYSTIGVLDLWFLFSGYPALAKVLQGAVGDQLLSGVTAKGVTALSFWYSAFFQLGSLSKITTPDQLDGAKIRVLQDPVSIAYMKAEGANPTPLAYGEVYSALQTHLISGVASNWSGFTGAKLQELIKYVTVLNAEAQAGLLVMNSTKFKSLPANYQKILVDTAKQEAPKELGYVIASDQSQQQVMTAAGVQVTTPTADQLQQWIDKARTVDPQFYTQFGQTLINQIIAANK
jgi:tripartite ATP-independent transporter DctP family solute receptor